MVALPDPVISHHSAAAIHNLSVPTGLPTVSVHTQTTHRFPGVHVIRCHDLRSTHVQLIDGLKSTTVARTIVDLSACVSKAQLVRTVDDALHQGKVTSEAIRTVLDDVARKGKPGVRTMRWVLSRIVDTTIPPSVLEARFHRLLTAHDITGFSTEYPIPWDPIRRFDVAFPLKQLAIELDSRQWHARIDAFERDRSRDRQVVEHGWRILRFTWSDLENDPFGIVGTINTALRQ